MDWSKVKNLFITLFLLLNAFLLFNIVSNLFERGISNQTIRDTVSILENRGVTFERKDKKIPIYNKKTGRLMYYDECIDKKLVYKELLKADNNQKISPVENEIFSEGTKTLIFKRFNGYDIFEYKNTDPNEKIDIMNSKATEKYLLNLISKLGLKDLDFELDSYSSNSEKKVFIQTYKEDMLFNNVIEFIISENGILEINGSLKKVRKYLSETKEEILPAYQVLLINTFSKGTIIRSIDFGFKPLNLGEMRDSPVWRIVIKDDSPKYIDAYTGQLIE